MDYLQLLAAYDKLEAAHEALKVELALVKEDNAAEVASYKLQLSEACAERDRLRMEKENPPADWHDHETPVPNQRDYIELQKQLDETQTMLFNVTSEKEAAEIALTVLRSKR